VNFQRKTKKRGGGEGGGDTDRWPRNHLRGWKGEKNNWGAQGKQGDKKAGGGKGQGKLDTGFLKPAGPVGGKKKNQGK